MIHNLNHKRKNNKVNETFMGRFIFVINIRHKELLLML